MSRCGCWVTRCSWTRPGRSWETIPWRRSWPCLSGAWTPPSTRPARPASLAGRAAAEALIRAFPGHFECRARGDEACLGRLRATGRTSSNPLCDLVRDKVIAPEDALPVGLTFLAVLADLARTSAFSVLDA